MVVSLTRQSSLLATLFAIGVIATSFVRQSLAPFAFELAEYGYLPAWWESSLSAVLLLATALVIGRTTVKCGAFPYFCTLPISLFAIIACGIYLSPESLTSSSVALLTAFGVMFMLRVLADFGNREHLFLASLCFGTTVVIYPPCVVMLALLPVAIATFPLNLRQSIVAVVGWLLPFAALSYVVWYMGYDIDAFAQHLWHRVMTSRGEFSLTPFPYAATAVAALLVMVLLAGIVVVQRARYTSLVGPRKFMELELLISFLTVAALALPGCGVAMLPVIGVPMSVVAAYTLDNMWSRAGSILYWLLLVGVFAHIFLN